MYNKTITKKMQLEYKFFDCIKGIKCILCKGICGTNRWMFFGHFLRLHTLETSCDIQTRGCTQKKYLFVQKTRFYFFNHY